MRACACGTGSVKHSVELNRRQRVGCFYPLGLDASETSLDHGNLSIDQCFAKQRVM